MLFKNYYQPAKTIITNHMMPYWRKYFPNLPSGLSIEDFFLAMKKVLWEAEMTTKVENSLRVTLSRSTKDLEKKKKEIQEEIKEMEKEKSLTEKEKTEIYERKIKFYKDELRDQKLAKSLNDEDKFKRWYPAGWFSFLIFGPPNEENKFSAISFQSGSGKKLEPLLIERVANIGKTAQVKKKTNEAEVVEHKFLVPRHEHFIKYFELLEKRKDIDKKYKRTVHNKCIEEFAEFLKLVLQVT